MNSILSYNYKVYFQEKGTDFLNSYLANTQPSKIFLLTDSNTNPNCLPVFLPSLATNVPIEIIEIEAGEPHKNIDTCTQVWYALSELGADRHSLLINIGGGVVTDLGGFVASTYMRGIPFINVPTSLLAMVDASVGGKTGVDLGSLKNLIGVINTPQGVIINTDYLMTLPANELRSGMAEMFKHGLINSASYWEKMCRLSEYDSEYLSTLIYESVLIKNEIVIQDPTEKGLRKTLNYGHTLGHAIESYCLQNPNRKRLIHGEAIAIGMVLASYLSATQLGFSLDDCNKIKAVLGEYFTKEYFSKEEITEICELMRFDKKNIGGNILFVLLEAIGKPKIDCIVPFEEIHKAFEYYHNN
ncbi:3-dehydroquinate synthase [Capnocytophaga sp. oral taxon 878]|uniref:3-dehydroquinate synthase n=1 Tax=Capnocytophaga sp. oral taxon 878 TaxID=1316596 RepID=UPI000D0318EB|nr:3-dehydroquinate synthase [Capnocytophaga sp. oral taxon 878]AVM49160.1 3-dehydroquinate synthase [Capnocytophaga sp. oral taxon 878]